MKLLNLKDLAIDTYPGIAALVNGCATTREIRVAIDGYKLGLHDVSRFAAGEWERLPIPLSPPIYKLYLVGHGDNKIGAIKVVRELTNLPLKESKEAVEHASANEPFLVASNLTFERARHLGAQLHAIGAGFRVEKL